MEDYFSKRLPELYAIAKARKIPGFSAMSKKPLVAALDTWDATHGTAQPKSNHPRYWGMKLPELEDFARRNHVRGFAGKNKPQLVALLEQHDRDALNQPTTSAPKEAQVDCHALSLPKLRTLARQRGIRDILRHTKAQLIEALTTTPVAREVEAVDLAPDYSGKSLAELRSLAKQRGLRNILHLNRLALIDALQPKAKLVEPAVSKPERQTPVAAPTPVPINIEGFLEVMSDGFGFIRSHDYHSGDNDTYVSPSLVRRFRLGTGDWLTGIRRNKSGSEKFAALSFVATVNGAPAEEACSRIPFERLTSVFPNKRYNLETPGGSVAMRIVNLISPIGRGQRGLIVSQPKAGKTTLIKDIAKSLLHNHPEVKLIILLIDERPEEVTDIADTITGKNVEVVASTFDKTPENHRHTAELTLERAKRMVEMKQNVVILMDSITRMTRAYNQTGQLSGRVMSGGLDSAALTMPKKFFGSARNTREGGSLTILATALIETGSRLDDIVYEEFKGTGNMELTLARKLQERRIFPAIDMPKSGTRREELLLSPEELEFVAKVRRTFQSEKDMDYIISMFAKTQSNAELISLLNGRK